MLHALVVSQYRSTAIGKLKPNTARNSGDATSLDNSSRFRSPHAGAVLRYNAGVGRREYPL